MSYSPTIRELFEHWNHGELLANLEAANKALLERRKDAVVMAPQSEPPKHTASNCLVLQQALLHRAERLQAEAVPMLLENNIYGLALVVRGHYEATAVLGYFCNRLESLKAGNIKFEDFAFNVAYEVLGAKHEQFAKAPNPPNILTCIEKADKYLDARFKKKTGMLLDCYNWLSDFAHPNFLSNASSFTVDKPNRQFVFRHGKGDIRESDFELIVYLDMSAMVFVQLFDDYLRLMNENGLSQ
jgi:hypothetical protein